MAVPTYAVFKTQTRLAAKGLRQGALRDVRGENIKLVDNALKAYDSVRNDNSVSKKYNALTNLLCECAKWLKLKRAKNGGSIVARRTAITTCATEAFNEMRAIQRYAAVDFYNLNKALATGNQPPNYQTKALAPGYHNERAVYISSNKQSPPAAAFVHEAQQELPNVGIPNSFQAEANVALTKNFDALTEQDYNVLAKAYGTAGVQKVHYSKKLERVAHHMVIYQGDHFDFEKIDSHAFDTRSDATGLFMYAMDEYGTLFASNTHGHGHGGEKLKQKGETYWNHSSFTAGKEVICAGNIKIHNGVLQYVDNASGHYKPTRDHLHNLLAIFAGEGIDLTTVTTLVRERVNAQTIEIHTLNAAQFLANANLRDPDVQVERPEG